MKNYCLLLLFLCFSFCGISQTWKHLGAYATHTNTWDIDPLGNIILAENDVLYKLDTNLTVRFKQNFKTFGNISSIDATHALKTLIFSENMQEIAFLDNTLTNTNGFLNLTEKNLEFVTHVSSSQISTRYWVYDEINSKLIRYDDGNTQPLIIENLSRLLQNSTLLNFSESENKIYLLSAENGVVILDNYGSFIKKVPTDNSSIIDVHNHRIYYLKNNNIYVIDKYGEKTVFKLPIKNCLDFKISGNLVFLKTADEIKKYSLIID